VESGAAMITESWLGRLQTLCEEFSHLGIGADIAAMSLIELWGLYRYLSRLADG
jgi:hypothetical protein